MVFNWAVTLSSLALLLIIMIVLFGNLSGNVGFASGTQNYNNTEQVIGNYTSSAVNTAGQFPTIGTLLGVVLLLTMLIGVLIFAIKSFNKVGGSASEGNFG